MFKLEYVVFHSNVWVESSYVRSRNGDSLSKLQCIWGLVTIVAFILFVRAFGIIVISTHWASCLLGLLVTFSASFRLSPDRIS